MLIFRTSPTVGFWPGHRPPFVRRITDWSKKTGAACLAFAFVGYLAGCSNPTQLWFSRERIDIWAVPEGATIFADSTREAENEVFSTGEGRVRLAGAINEAVSFQVAFRSERPANLASVSMSDLRFHDQAIPADRVAFFKETRVSVADYPAWFLRLTPYLRQPRGYPDILVPLDAPRGGLPIELQAGTTEALWCEIRIPPGTPPGRYDAKLRLADRMGVAGELAVQLEVWPFALPLTRHLAVTAGLDTAALLRQHLEVNGKPYTPGQLSFDDPMYLKATTVLDSAVRLLHDHRCGPFLSDVLPRRDAGPGGLARLDWTDYDRLVASIVDGSAFPDRAAAAAWPVPVNDRNPPADVFGGNRSAGYERMLVDYLRQCLTHFQERGWSDRHFVWIPISGATTAERYDEFERVGKLIRSADGRLKTVCTLPPQSMSAWGCRDAGFRDVSDLVGIWAPPADTADASQFARQRAAGRRTWLNPSRPPFSGSTAIVAPGEHMRSLAWQAYRLGCDGVLLEAINTCAADGKPATTGEGCLIWPGRAYGLPGPVASIRLKRLLRGIQDYEYLWLLERNRRPAIARRIVADLFPFGGTASFGDNCLDGRPGAWAGDPSAWSLARRLAAGEIVSAMEESASKPADREAADLEQFDRQIEWRRFTDNVRKVRVEVEGVRVGFDPSNTRTPVLLNAAVTLLNVTRSKVDGRLVLADVPAGWSLRETDASVAGMEPSAGLRRVLHIDAAQLLPNVDGVAPLRLAIDRGKGLLDVGESRIAFLTSQRLVNPIVLDGKLDDWPLGAG